MNSESLSVLSYEGYQVSFLPTDAEKRCHAYIHNGYRKAKFWMTPGVENAVNEGFTDAQLNELSDLLRDQASYIIQFWNKMFGENVSLPDNHNPILLDRLDRNRISYHSTGRSLTINASRLIEMVLNQGVEDGTIMLNKSG